MGARHGPLVHPWLDDQHDAPNALADVVDAAMALARSSPGVVRACGRSKMPDALLLHHRLVLRSVDGLLGETGFPREGTHAVTIGPSPVSVLAARKFVAVMETEQDARLFFVRLLGDVALLLPQAGVSLCMHHIDRTDVRMPAGRPTTAWYGALLREKHLADWALVDVEPLRKAAARHGLPFFKRAATLQFASLSTPIAAHP